MKKSFFLLCITMMIITTCQHQQSGSKGQKEDLSALTSAVGKYPREVKLLENAVLSARLKTLLGEPTFQIMLREWNTETPIEMEGGILHTSGCQDNNCGEIGYHLFIDPVGDNINLFSFRNQEMMTYQEKGAISLPDSLAWDFEIVKHNYRIPADQIDPDPTDDVPAGQYAATTADLQMALNIRNALINDLLKDEVNNIPQESRRFHYDQVDLSGDGKNEYLVGLQTPYFCGTGGCTFLLLDHEGNLVTRFTVSRAPFIVLPSMSKGWNDLVVYSGGTLRKLTFDGTTYPFNPSTEPEYTETPGDDLRRLLDDDASPIPAFNF